MCSLTDTKWISEVHFRLIFFCRVLVNTSRYCKGTCFYHGSTTPCWSRPPHCWGFMVTLRHTTVGRTPLDEWSAWRRDLYLTTKHTHKRQTFMSLARFEPRVSPSEGPQTHTLDRAATGVGKGTFSLLNISLFVSTFEYVAGCGCCESFSPTTIILLTYLLYSLYWWTRWRSWLRHCATSQKVAGSIPDGVIGVFHSHNPPGRTVALGSTQPLTQMSTRNISWGVKAASA